MWKNFTNLTLFILFSIKRYALTEI
jgi:hypothetical protein